MVRAITMRNSATVLPVCAAAAGIVDLSLVLMVFWPHAIEFDIVRCSWQRYLGAGGRAPRQRGGGFHPILAEVAERAAPISPCCPY
jgi:hypothetical protein